MLPRRPRTLATLAALTLLPTAAVVAPAAMGAGAASAAGHRPAAAGSCTNTSKLATWRNSRLAAETIAVPVEETSVGDVDSEVGNGVGGVLLFGSSAPSNLGSELAALASRSPGRHGLLIMTDEEGGGVQRMANLVGNLPWPRQMSQWWTPDTIDSKVAAVARRMAAANVDMDLAPVVDVDGRDTPPNQSDPDGYRSFSGKTSVVSADGWGFLAGLATGHVIAVVKHFPGLGGASGNTDYGPAHTLPWSTLQKVAIPPFAHAINSGVPGVMVSNATVPGLSPKVPASLSATVITTELDGRLHFRGLVLTDSLTAGAILDGGYRLDQATVLAIKAGADMVLFGFVKQNEADTTQGMINALVTAVGQGKLARSRLIDAAAAVLAAHRVMLCPS
jgi:beta-N-acetylhexosaminidase